MSDSERIDALERRSAALEYALRVMAWLHAEQVFRHAMLVRDLNALLAAAQRARNPAVVARARRIAEARARAAETSGVM